MADIRVNVINSYIKKHGKIDFNLRLLMVNNRPVTVLNSMIFNTYDGVVIKMIDDYHHDMYVKPKELLHMFGDRGLQVIYETLVDKMNLYELLNVALIGGIKC